MSWKYSEAVVSRFYWSIKVPGIDYDPVCPWWWIRWWRYDVDEYDLTALENNDDDDDGNAGNDGGCGDGGVDGGGGGGGDEN